MKLVSTGSFAPHWMGMVCMVPDWNFVTNKAGLRVSRLPNSFTRNSEYPRVQMGIPRHAPGYRNGYSLGYRWVLMGIDGYFAIFDADRCFWHGNRLRVGLCLRQCSDCPMADKIPNESRKRVRDYPEEIPRTGSGDPEAIPRVVGIKSGSWRVSPLDFGIKKIFYVLEGKIDGSP